MISLGENIGEMAIEPEAIINKKNSIDQTVKELSLNTGEEL
jgi:hypothetical protein